VTATPKNNYALAQDDDEHAFWPSLHSAARTPQVHNAITELYERLDAQVCQRGPVCWSSGKCCNFEQYGHRLYVTALEIAWVLAQAQTPVGDHTPPEVAAGQRVKLDQLTLQESCPYQIDRLCSIHTIRPMGCRVFFCQQGTEQWQKDLYETFLTKLRRLHDDFALPYRYMEWRAGLHDAVHTHSI